MDQSAGAFSHMLLSLTRWLASVSGVILTTSLIDKLVTREDKAAIYGKHGAGY